ncbi:hypothetical protein B0H11DRAFT_1995141 [Mycena galericulata]|nr:hypothetical protein B0H11DRAFT_1995141 [Mycena galericulata]
MAYYQTPYLHVQQETARPQRRETARLQPREQLREQAQRLDACVFVPGLFRFPVPPPTPAAILNGGYCPEQECIEYFPRRPEFCGRPSLSIAFAVHGHPAPYLKDILKERVVLDRAHEAVMAEQGWSRTRWVLEVRLSVTRLLAARS